MVVLGVDPGTLVTGYGVIESRKHTLRVLSCGAIHNEGKRSMGYRLRIIFETLNEIILKFHPDEFAIETAFYGKNAQSALKLGHARGVALLAAVAHGIPTHEYSPREVKKAIVGNGSASKDQVQFMVKSLLHVKELPEEYDVTDALAVAVCHLNRNAPSTESSFKSWKAYVTAHPDKVARSTRGTTE